MHQTISWDDDCCAVCKTPKPVHDDLLRRYGGIRYILPKNLTARFFFDSDPFPLEPMPYDVKICREFVKKFEIYDRDGRLV